MYCLYLVISFTCGCMASLTGEIQVYPQQVFATPGQNVAFLCNSSMDITKLRWAINDRAADSEYVEIIDRHSMKLEIRNAGMVKSYPGSIDVECIFGDKKNGATLYIGYPPTLSKLECMAQDLEKIHCRWSNWDERIRGQDWLKHETNYKMDYSIIGGGKAMGSCSITSQSSSVCELNDGWDFAFNVRFILNATNVMGSSNTSIHFAPHEHVMLSPPVLHFSNITDKENWGSSVQVSMSSTSFAEENYHNCIFSVELQYGEIPDGADQSLLLQKSTEHDFWEDWNKMANFEEYRPLPIKNFSVIEDIYTKMDIHDLPANTKILFRARWKWNGGGNILFSCDGTWSLYNTAIVRTMLIEPPSFARAAILYFDGEVISPGPRLKSSGVIVRSDQKNWMDFSSPLILWKHSNRDMDIHRNNHLRYEIMVKDCGLFNAKTVSNFSLCMPLPRQVITENCALEVGCINSEGSRVSPQFRFSSEKIGTGCELKVLSFTLEKIVATKLRFKVSWAVVPRNTTQTCNKNINENELKTGIFIWREEHSRQVEDLPQRKGIGFSKKTFHLEITSAPSNASSSVSKDSKIDFDVKEYGNPVVGFTHSFMPHTAYRIAVAISFSSENMVIQGPASLDRNLYYYGTQEPTGVVPEIRCANVTANSMEVIWKQLDPSNRNGPITEYLVYYTSNEKCFAGHQSITCNGLYGDCDENDVTVDRISFQKKTVKRDVADVSWMVEEPEGSVISYTLKDLDSSTTYFVGVVAQNTARRGRCIRHVVQTTLKMVDARFVYIPIILMAFAIASSCILYRLRGIIKSYFNAPLPEPVIHVSTSEDDEERVEFTAYEKTHTERVDSIDVSLLGNNNAFPPLPKQDEKNFSSVKPAVKHDYCNSPCENLGRVGLYLRDASPQDQIHHASLARHDTNSLASNVPCCSRSSTADENRSPPSSGASYGSDSDDDIAIYTSPEVALLCGRAPKFPIES